jgi:hypothetical protein
MQCKEALAINVELAAPDHFIPVPPGWRPEARSSGNWAMACQQARARPTAPPEASSVSPASLPTWGTIGIAAAGAALVGFLAGWFARGQ